MINDIDTEGVLNEIFKGSLSAMTMAVYPPSAITESIKLMQEVDQSLGQEGPPPLASLAPSPNNR
jgi:hypothetical protein